MSVDMHCHLDLYTDPFRVAAECRRRGTYVLSVTTTPSAWEGTCQLARSNDRIRTALGLHPQIAHLRYQELEQFDAKLSQTRYVGEIGLDGGKNFKGHWEVQLQVFRHILNSVNQAGGRIMSIHSVASTSAVLDELNGINGTPIFHWFTGSKSHLKRAIDMGGWLSVGPAMLNTKRGKELVSATPMSRILTETDGPFAKHDGKPLSPWDVDFANKQLADIWQCNEVEAKAIILANFKTLVSK